MNPSLPRSNRLLFIASIAIMVVSLTFSAFSVTTVLAERQAIPVTVPNVVGFEGFLADESGVGLNGSHSLTFSIYDGPNPLTDEQKWSEPPKAVLISNGLYSVMLGSVTTFSANLFDGDRWIGVAVDGGPVMTPMTQIASVPFALNADSANKVGGTSLSGMIAIFDAASCPAGWTEVDSTRGRVVVGMPAGGTLNGTVGTALGNQGLRTITDVPAHTHGAGTLLADSAGSHSHSVSPQSCCGGGNAPPRANTDTDGGSAGSWGTNSAGAHTHTISGSTASTGVAAVDVTMPYIQLVYCQLN